MRKIFTLLILLLCVTSMARGQDETVTGYDCECLIDGVSVKQGTMPPSGGQSQWQIDASALPLGLHHVQTRIVQHRSSGVAVTAVYDALCFRIAASSSHQVKATCHIDGVKVKSSTLTTDGATKTWRIDLSDLPEGLHSVKVTITDKDPDGVARTYVYDAMCYRTSTSSHHEVTATCYVDGEMKKTSTINADGEPVSWILDLSDLPEGVHQVRVDIADKNHEGIVTTSTYEGTCYRAAPGEGHNVTATCYVDEQLVKTQEIIPDGNTQNWMLDLGELPVGLHRVRVDVADKNNEGMVATARYDAMCYRTSSGATHNVKAKCYVDGQLVKTKTVQTNGAANAWTLDLATMKRGMHHVRVSINDKDGYGITTSTTFDAMCYRGIGRVTGYEYWINNDNSIHNEVELSEPQLEYTLISLLPIPKQNIRSKKFHFEINDGQPMLYARNDIRVRFNTEDGSYTEVNGDFVDYRVSQSIDAEFLTSGDHKTINRPNDNTIKWFKLDATRGDSLRFYLDKACTLQLFAPDNQEIFAADGADAVKWNGVTVWTAGTYYLAIHDMTATTGNVINLDYELIDHYAILRQDVNIVGNGGASNIKFDGNGFDYLDSLCLVKGDNVIWDYHTNHISNSQIDVMFDFTDCELGKYDLIGYFDGETRTIPNAIEVVEADSIKLAFNVSYPSQFLRGTSTTYTFKITNKGNSTAYQVPLEIQIFSSSPDAITYAKFSNNIPPVTADWLDDVDYTEDDKMYVEHFQNKMGDLLHYITLYDSINNKYVKYGFFVLNIPSKSTITISLTLKSDETIELLAHIPSNWNFYIPEFEDVLSKNANKDFQQDACCYRDKVECALSIIGDLADLASFVPQAALAACVASLATTVLTYSYQVWCGEQIGGKPPRQAAEGLLGKALNGLIGCIAGKIGKAFDIAFKIWTNGYNAASFKMNDECHLASSEGIPNCPPGGGHHGGGTSSPVAPCEPNEMLGYTSPSGSHYIGNGLTDVYYTICFENDSAATSPANVIILTDTIDGGVHDLNTFAPTRVKIGDVEAQLSGDPNFIQTVDMRPRINCIAQVECNYDKQKGIAVFTLTSLDPMTLEPVTDHNQGMLPPNGIDDYGQGEMSFNISLKEGLPDGTVIKNHADNIFDSEDPVFTPDWENIIDAVNPTSRVIGCELLNDSTAIVSINGEDNRSGPWRYDIYTQYEDGEWYKTASGVPIDSLARVRVYEGIDHGFCVVLTDSAGNVENKPFERELSFDYFDSSTDSELTLALAKNWNWMSHNLNAPLEVTALQPNAYRIVGQEGETIKDPSYGYTGTISTLDPTKLYKVQMTKAANVQLQGKLYNVAFKSTDLSAGWNWLGYPLAAKLAPSVALANLDAQDGDCILGQDGMTMFNNGQWSGTLSQLKPGKGYMLKIQSNATLHWNAPRVSSSQHAPGIKNNGDAAPYSVDAYLYPNVMGIVADLYDSGSPVDPDDYWLVAFCGEECRGVAQTVDGHLMMNIYGNSGETVTFKVIDRNTQAVDDVAEKRAFAQDVEGTLQTPLVLNIGTSGLSGLTVKGLRVYPTVTKGDVNVTTSYGDIESVEVLNAKGQTVMSLQNMGSSAVVGLSDLPDGIYMIRVTTDNGTSTTKVVKQK